MEQPSSAETTPSTYSKNMWGDRYLKRIMMNTSVRIDSLIIRYTHEDVHCVMTCKVPSSRSLHRSTLSSCQAVLKTTGSTAGRSLA